MVQDSSSSTLLHFVFPIRFFYLKSLFPSLLSRVFVLFCIFPLFSFSRVGRLADVVVVVVVDGWCARSFFQNLSLVCDDDDDVAR